MSKLTDIKNKMKQLEGKLSQIFAVELREIVPNSVEIEVAVTAKV